MPSVMKYYEMLNPKPIFQTFSNIFSSKWLWTESMSNAMELSICIKLFLKVLNILNKIQEKAYGVMLFTYDIS